jgi:hypothetical protein
MTGTYLEVWGFESEDGLLLNLSLKRGMAGILLKTVTEKEAPGEILAISLFHRIPVKSANKESTNVVLRACESLACIENGQTKEETCPTN